MEKKVEGGFLIDHELDMEMKLTPMNGTSDFRRLFPCKKTRKQSVSH